MMNVLLITDGTDTCIGKISVSIDNGHIKFQADVYESPDEYATLTDVDLATLQDKVRASQPCIIRFIAYNA